jgi:hypothetical protein
MLPPRSVHRSPCSLAGHPDKLTHLLQTTCHHCVARDVTLPFDAIRKGKAAAYLGLASVDGPTLLLARHRGLFSSHLPTAIHELRLSR